MRKFLLTALTLAGALAPPARAIDIVFDYRFDTNNYFGGANVGRRALLDQAAATFEGFTDQLTAITSGGSNNFTATGFDPGSGGGNATFSIPNFSVPANTLVIFAGGQALNGPLAIGGPGGFGVSGDSAFVNNAVTRGQAGAANSPPTDFGPYGGSISFNTNANFFFGSDTAGLTGGQSDFLSTAIHEIAHSMGFGTSPAFTARISGGAFTGPAATASFGGPVPVTGDGGHWANGTQSRVNGAAQEAAMDPSILNGTRKLFTELDYAGMSDMGWEVAPVPEPAGLLLVGAAAVAVARRRRA